MSNNDEDSLFAPAVQATYAKAGSKNGSFTISSEQKMGLFTKKRTNSKVFENGGAGQKKDENPSGVDNLFAPVAAERPSVAQQKRNLSSDFFKKLESNTLKSAVDAKKEDGKKKELRGRGSVAAHAALFESAIQANSVKP